MDRGYVDGVGVLYGRYLSNYSVDLDTLSVTDRKWLTALGPVIEDRARELNSMSEDNEFKILVLGALNWLLGASISNSELRAYYTEDWLPRQSKLIQVLQAQKDER